MVQVIPATFEHGVFKPDKQPDLTDHARVRLLVEPVSEDSAEPLRQQAWDNLERIWQNPTFDSHGDRLTRDQLHERH